MEIETNSPTFTASETIFLCDSGSLLRWVWRETNDKEASICGGYKVSRCRTISRHGFQNPTPGFPVDYPILERRLRSLDTAVTLHPVIPVSMPPRATTTLTASTRFLSKEQYNWLPAIVVTGTCSDSHQSKLHHILQENLVNLGDPVTL